MIDVGGTHACKGNRQMRECVCGFPNIQKDLLGPMILDLTIWVLAISQTTKFIE